jgi:hypothetical protein
MTDRILILSDGVEREATDQERAELAALAEVPPPPRPPRSIAKSLLIRRASDVELDQLLLWLRASATPRQRALWDHAHGNEVLVAEIEPVAVALFGQKRAGELLA